MPIYEYIYASEIGSKININFESTFQTHFSFRPLSFTRTFNYTSRTENLKRCSAFEVHACFCILKCTLYKYTPWDWSLKLQNVRRQRHAKPFVLMHSDFQFCSRSEWWWWWWCMCVIRKKLNQLSHIRVIVLEMHVCDIYIYRLAIVESKHVSVSAIRLERSHNRLTFHIVGFRRHESWI